MKNGGFGGVEWEKLNETNAIGEREESLLRRGLADGIHRNFIKK